jgi:hypothetical protein
VLVREPELLVRRQACVDRFVELESPDPFGAVTDERPVTILASPDRVARLSLFRDIDDQDEDPADLAARDVRRITRANITRSTQTVSDLRFEYLRLSGKGCIKVRLEVFERRLPDYLPERLANEVVGVQAKPVGVCPD